MAVLIVFALFFLVLVEVYIWIEKHETVEHLTIPVLLHI